VFRDSWVGTIPLTGIDARQQTATGHAPERLVYSVTAQPVVLGFGRRQADPCQVHALDEVNYVDQGGSDAVAPLHGLRELLSQRGDFWGLSRSGSHFSLGD
jgi:hypothetical protein